MFESWKNSVLGQVLDTDHVISDKGQCSQVPLSWAEALYPGVTWTKLLPAIGSNAGVDEWAGESTGYFTWIANNHADVNQLPMQGDIMVFGPTPESGYSDTFKNPYGHAGVCDSASVSGYTLVQQNAPNFGEAVNDTSYGWHVRPCLGWFRAINQVVNAPNPAPIPPVSSINVGKTLTLPRTNADGTADTIWHTYNTTGPYDYAHATHILDPAEFGGLQYKILADKGNGVFVIQTQDFGQVAVWTHGTNATIS